MSRSRLAAVCIGIAALIVSITPGPALARQGVSVSRQAAAPVFSFPTNGTSYPSNGSYVFQVQPLSGAKGYLWSFVQNGMVVYQNLAWDGHLSPSNYTVSTNSKAHSMIHPGDLHVWVRALMKNGQWSATGAVMVRIHGHGSSQTAPKPTPANILYQANASNHGFDQWQGLGWKHFQGMLINDGTGDGTPIMIPFQPRQADYAVEVEIQEVRKCDLSTGDCPFGVIVRAPDAGGGYAAGVYNSGIGGENAYVEVAINGNVKKCCDAVGTFNADQNWHTYRVEVRGNTVSLFIDGSPKGKLADNQFLDAGKIGLFDADNQVNVRSFKVIAL